MRPAVFVAALVVSSLSLVAPAEAQTRPAFFDQPSEIRQVGTMEPGQRYPMVIMLPPTNGTSHRSFDQYRGAIPFDAYYVMLTPGQPQTTDYLPRFYNYVTWADERVGADLEQASARYAVDPERVYLAGFSLGGDTSWALLLRHPERYRGAIVMGRGAARAPAGTHSP